MANVGRIYKTILFYCYAVVGISTVKQFTAQNMGNFKQRKALSYLKCVQHGHNWPNVLPFG
jgi:hypothetical protein